MSTTANSEEGKKTTALTAMAENFGKDFSDALLDMWLNLLAENTASQVFEAVKIVIDRYEFKTLPPFAVLKSALDEISGTGAKALEAQALAEWGVLREQVRRIGFYGRPILHPTTAYVVRLLGGWEAVCGWTYDNAEFRRREFLRMWPEVHGKVDAMRLGCDGVRAALAGRMGGPAHISALPKLAGGGGGA